MKPSVKLALEVLLESGIIEPISDGWKFVEKKIEIVPKNDKLTPIQLLIRSFKIAKGIDPDNKLWDKKFFSRNSRVAKDLLAAFDGNADKAAVYMLTKAEEWKELDWGLEAIIRSAARDYNKIQGEDDGYKHSEVGEDRALGHGGYPRITQTRELAGRAIAEIGKRGKAADRLAGTAGGKSSGLDGENGREVPIDAVLAQGNGRINKSGENEGV